MIFKALHNACHKALHWPTKEHCKKHLKTVGLVIAVIFRDFVQGKLPLRATSLVYTTILSFAPLLALSFSVLKSFGAHNQLAPFLESALAPLGAKGLELSSTILMFVDNIKVGVLGAVGLGFLLFTVVSLVQKIEAAFNDIWHVEKERPHVQRFTGYLSVITVGPIVIFALVGLKAKFTTNPYVADALGIATSTGFTSNIVEIISAVAMPIILFTFMNKAIPNTKVKWIPALVSGIITAFMWKAVASGFTGFMGDTTSYDAIYSSFAIILLVFIWLYLNWLIILIGGSICFYIQNPEQARLSFHATEMCQQDKLYSALALIKEIDSRYESGKQPLTETTASKLFGSTVLLNDVLMRLTHADILVCPEETQEILLKKSSDKLTLHDVIMAISGRKQLLTRNAKDQQVLKIVQNIENEWKKQSLKKLFKNT